MPNTTAQDILDKALRRQIYISRFTKRFANDVTKLLKDSEKDILERLANLEGKSFTQNRLESMLEYIKAVNSQVYGKVGEDVRKTLKQFAKDEIHFQIKAIQKSYPIDLGLEKPTAGQVYAAAIAQPMQGHLFLAWLKGMDKSTVDKMVAQVRIGFVEGQTIGQMTSSIKSIYPSTRRGVEAFVRTATTHIANVARDNLYEANKDLFKGVKWVSTLDGRTTPICQRRDGKIFELGKGPRPPAHWGCRSTTIPVLKSWTELGLGELEETDKLSKRPFVTDKRRVADIPKSERNIGLTTANETYGQWLKRQPAKFQDSVLGKAKGKLFRLGGLPIEKFSDKTGKAYTLDELKKREPDIFNSTF